MLLLLLWCVCVALLARRLNLLWSSHYRYYSSTHLPANVVLVLTCLIVLDKLELKALVVRLTAAPCC